MKRTVIAIPSTRDARTLWGACVLVVATAVPGVAGNLSLSPATAQAWEDFVRTENARMVQRANSGEHFLWVDEEPDRLAKVRAGEVEIAPLVNGGYTKVPSGLIHHWIGAIFIPDTRIDDVLHVVRDYPRYKVLYQPSVTDSKAISTSEAKDRFSTLMVNRKFLLKSAFEVDYESCYVRQNEHQLYSFMRSTRIQEIEDYGSAGQHMLREGEGSGIMWKAFSVTRYAERDGGIYIEVEAMGLTRDIPSTLHWLVDPIVRRLAKSALMVSLRQTEKASKSVAEEARRQRAPSLSAAGAGGGAARR